MTRSTAVTAGAVSGCTVWLVLMAVFAMCLVPVACLFTLFTSASDLAAGIIGPIVCPAHSTAIIERAPTTYVNDDGFVREAMGAEMVCVDAAGQVVARPAPLPNWLWHGTVGVAALVLSGALGFVFAAPAGAVVGRAFGGRLKR